MLGCSTRQKAKLFTIINKWRRNNNVFDKFNTSTAPVSNKLHSQAIYTSRLLDTSNLSLPVNGSGFDIQLKKLASKNILEG
jgi:hypothetical protein